MPECATCGADLRSMGHQNGCDVSSLLSLRRERDALREENERLRALVAAPEGVPTFDAVNREMGRIVTDLYHARARVEELEAGLRDLLDGAIDMRDYVPEQFARKWKHDAYLARATTVLSGGCPAECDAGCDSDADRAPITPEPRPDTDETCPARSGANDDFRPCVLPRGHDGDHLSDFGDAFRPATETCPDCEGRGYSEQWTRRLGYIDGDDCSSCEGSGRRPNTKETKT